jgi:hypothetical protein
MSENDTILINLYLQSLNTQEKKTLEIAKDHLGSSFNMVKSIGFIKWNQLRQNNI